MIYIIVDDNIKELEVNEVREESFGKVVNAGKVVYKDYYPGEYYPDYEAAREALIQKLEKDIEKIESRLMKKEGKLKLLKKELGLAK